MTHKHECNRIQKLLPYYAVGALKRHHMTVIEQHVNSCAECKAELEALNKTASEVEAIGLETPPDMWEAIRERLQPRRIKVGRERLSGWLHSRTIQSALAAGAVVLVLVGLLLNIEPGGPQFTAHSYIATHARITWSEPFADKVALGLITTAQLETER